MKLKKLFKSAAKLAAAPFTAPTDLLKKALLPLMPSLEIPVMPAQDAGSTPQLSIGPDPAELAKRRTALRRRASSGISGLTIARSAGLAIPA